MLCNIENLHVGQWVAVDRTRTDCQCLACKPRGVFTGYPVQVIAISAPWIMVRTMAGSTDAIDLRDFGVRQLHRTFVRKMHQEPPERVLAAMVAHDHTHQHCVEGEEPIDIRETKPVRPLCEWCGEWMRETTVPGEYQCVRCHRTRRSDT